MSLKAAVDRVLTWTFTGISNQGYQAGVVAETDLPAVVLRMGGTGGETLRALGISTVQGRVVVHMEHLLLISGLGMGLNEDRLYGALVHVDNYLDKVISDLTLNGNLIEPLAIADTSDAPIEIGNVLYYGITFRHRWVLKQD